MKFSYTTALVTLVGLAVAHETAAVKESIVAPPADAKDLAPEFKIIRTNDISCTIKSQVATIPAPLFAASVYM